MGVSSAGTRRATIGGNYGGVTRLSADGNEPEELTTIDVEAGEVGHYFPQLIPGDELVLTVIERNPYFGGQSLDVIDLDTGTRTTLVPGATRGRYTPSGHLVWSEDDGRLRASRLDLNRLELTGPIVTIAEDVSGAAGGGFPQFDVSDSGDLVYVPAQPRDLVMVDRTGRAESIADVEDLVHSPRISPDGRRIVMDITGVGRDIWVLDIAGGTLQKVTFTGAANDPIWTPDGRHVTYASLVNGKRGIYRVPADGSAEPDSIYWSADTERSPGSWFPDGETLMSIAVTQSGWQLETISLGEDRSPEPVVSTRPEQAWPAVSPDGRWLAYQSDESGRAEVYVRPIDGSSRVLVSRDGGGSPMWHPSGREIFYRHQSGPVGVLVAASVDPGPPFRVVSRTDLFPVGDIEAASPHTNYDVHPDGDHFIMVRIRGGTELVYVQNWTALFE